jgi:hypothetical protein
MLIVPQRGGSRCPERLTRERQELSEQVGLFALRAGGPPSFMGSSSPGAATWPLGDHITFGQGQCQGHMVTAGGKPCDRGKSRGRYIENDTAKGGHR